MNKSGNQFTSLKLIIMTQKEKEQLLHDIWWSRNPSHGTNLNSGEDMFFGTVLCVFNDFKNAVDKIESGEAKENKGTIIERIKSLVEDLGGEVDTNQLDASLFDEYGQEICSLDMDGAFVYEEGRIEAVEVSYKLHSHKTHLTIMDALNDYLNHQEMLERSKER